jgi:hypothetical protein
MMFSPQIRFRAGYGKGRQVFADRRHALHHRHGADAHELMHAAVAGDQDLILDSHVPGQQSAIRDYNAVAQWQLCAICELTIRKQSEPITVFSSNLFDRWMVTCSRNTLSLPIRSPSAGRGTSGPAAHRQ